MGSGKAVFSCDFVSTWICQNPKARSSVEKWHALLNWSSRSSMRSRENVSALVTAFSHVIHTKQEGGTNKPRLLHLLKLFSYLLPNNKRHSPTRYFWGGASSVSISNCTISVSPRSPSSKLNTSWWSARKSSSCWSSSGGIIGSCQGASPSVVHNLNCWVCWHPLKPESFLITT